MIQEHLGLPQPRGSGSNGPPVPARRRSRGGLRVPHVPRRPVPQHHLDCGDGVEGPAGRTRWYVSSRAVMPKAVGKSRTEMQHLLRVFLSGSASSEKHSRQLTSFTACTGVQRTRIFLRDDGGVLWDRNVLGVVSALAGARHELGHDSIVGVGLKGGLWYAADWEGPMVL
jgi:hypothetical protein